MGPNGGVVGLNGGVGSREALGALEIVGSRGGEVGAGVILESTAVEEVEKSERD